MLGAISAGIQGLSGIAQLIAGTRMAKRNVSPELEIPDSATEALSLARGSASSTLLPGQGYYEAKLDRSKAQGLSAARESAGSPAQLMEAALSLNENSSDQILNMAMMGSERRDRNIMNLQNQLGTMANWEKLQFDINEMQPYQEKAALASSLQGAGMQNIFGAASGGVAMGIASKQENMIAGILKRLRDGETMSEALQ